jgi:hypothetical protein
MRQLAEDFKTSGFIRLKVSHSATRLRRHRQKKPYRYRHWLQRQRPLNAVLGDSSSWSGADFRCIDGWTTIRTGVLAVLMALALLAPPTWALAQTPSAVAQVTISPSQGAAFGNQQLGTSSNPQTLTVSNNQAVPLNFSSIQLASPNFVQSNTCGSSIAANSSCIITVVFTPKALGALKGVIKLTDDASNSPQAINLSGFGTLGPVTFSPPGIFFGNIFVRTTSAPQTITLSNNQSGPLTISGISTSLAAFTQDNDCPNILSAGASCTITLTFTPSAIKTFQGFLIDNDDSATSPNQISVRGTGVSPVTVSPTSGVPFGSQVIHTSSSPQIVTVSNVQNVTLNFSSIQLLSPNFHQSNTCGSSIPANSSCTVTIVFTPTLLGPLTGVVKLSDDASNSPQAIQLSGTGVAASPTPTPSATPTANPTPTPSPTPSPTPGSIASVLTYHYDNIRSGANTNETILTPANVNMKQFGKLFSVPVDSLILAQPLFVPNLQVPGLGTHNVVYIGTQHNSLYAFDADNGATLWSVNLGPYQPKSGGESDIDAGIIGTPVIDSNTIYVVARTLRNGISNYELHALNITTGVEAPSSPMVISGRVSGTGYGSAGGVVTFTPAAQRQTLASLLDNGVLYIGFSNCQYGSCDGDGFGHAHGWLFVYNPSNLQQQGVFVTSPNDYGAGIWEGGGGPAADVAHNIYFSTGNGDFDVGQGGSDYGDSVLKLTPGSLAVQDYFTPFNAATLAANDEDLGAGGVTLLPDQPASPTHLLVTAGKQGLIYLINRDNMGQFDGNVDHVVQELPGINALYSTPTFWNNTLYFGGANSDHVKAFSLSNGSLSVSPTSQSIEKNPSIWTVTLVSANGQTNGILWAVQHGGSPTGNEVLHAYDATNLTKELYTSSQAGTRDLPGIPGIPFESFIEANGKVYVPTGQPQLTVFGLLNQQ